MRLRESTGPGSAEPIGLPPTQLLERNIGRIEGSNLLLLGVPRDPKVVSLFRDHNGVLLSSDYSAHLLNTQLVRDSNAALQPVFAAAYAPPEPRHDVVVAYLQKGNEANDCMLAIAGSVVSTGGASSSSGTILPASSRMRRRLENRVGAIEFSDSARHCVLYRARSAEPMREVSLEVWERRFHVPVGNGGIDVISLPGVFSHGRLDEGTAFLLRHIPSDIRGAVLDFGCGSGVLGATIKSLNPGVEVTLVDSNAFAIESAQRTFSANGLAPREIRPVDGLDGVSDQRFDMIITNPPFHQGIGTDYDRGGAVSSIV